MMMNEDPMDIDYGVVSTAAIISLSGPVPPKEAAMRDVLNNPEANWKKLHPIYKNAKDCIITVLRKAKTLPPKSDFERQFPQKLRFDKDVVLAFCERSDFETLYYDRHLFVPGCLINNKQVMLAYCSKIRRSLQECSEDLTDDREVVLAAIGLDGLELQYASRRLQEDEAILRTACASDGRALDFCPPGEIRDRLLDDRDFMLTVLKNNGGSLLRLVKDPLARDRELLLTAVQHGMRLRYCPPPCQTDKEFVVAAVTRKASVYLELATVLQKDPDIAQAAAAASDSDHKVQQRALEQVPTIRRHRNVVVAIVDRGEVAFMKDYLLETNNWRGDKAIMLRAVERDSNLYQHCTGGLREDPDIVMAAMTEESAMTVIRSVPAPWLTRHPEAVIKAVSVVHTRNLRTIRAFIADELWDNRELIKAWIGRGCRVLDIFVARVRNDREMALHIAEFSWGEFNKVSEVFRGDYAFMKEAVSLSGRVLRYATPELRGNMELAVRAVANHAHSLSPAIPIQKTALMQHVEQQLDNREVFVTQFLRGIAVSRQDLPPGLRSALPMLDRGVETGQAFKKLIAAFLGVPVGELLTIYRKCLDHLKNPPPLELNEPLAADDPFDIAQRFAGMANVDRIERHRMLRRRMRNRMRGVGPDDDDEDDDDMDDPFAMMGLGLRNPVVGQPLGPRGNANVNNAAAAGNNNDNNGVAGPAGPGNNNPNVIRLPPPPMPPRPPMRPPFAAMRAARALARNDAAQRPAAAANAAAADNNNAEVAEPPFRRAFLFGRPREPPRAPAPPAVNRPPAGGLVIRFGGGDPMDDDLDELALFGMME